MEINAEELRKYGEIYEPRCFIENEGNPNFSEKDLNAGVIDDNDYYLSRACLTRACVDGLISCLNEEGKRGILLVTRKGNPAKGKLWPVGGGLPRGIVGPRKALTSIALRECNQNLTDFVYLGGVDFGWATTPKIMDKGGKGIRDLGLIYYAQGGGELRFKNLDNDPLIVTPEMWDKKDGKLGNLHRYVSSNIEKAMVLLMDRFY